tara:strand:+ start:1613 stop:1918 length:306 start_codon:yes stop_codon:yes gene_type:complete
MIEIIKELIDKIPISLILLKLIFLKISSSSLSINLIKRNCVDIKKINGNVSYTIVGAVNSVRSIGNNEFTSISLKKETSSNIFNIIEREKKISETKNKIIQ